MSACRWINDVCKDVPEQILAEPWARDFRRFMEIADRTLSRRKSRRLSAIEKAAKQPKRPRSKVTCPTDVGLRDAFPTPNYDHNTLVEALTVRMPALATLARRDRL